MENDTIVKEDEDKKIKPFLKWAGGKYKIIDDIKKCFPEHVNRYIEPFVGAGSVALNMDCKEIIINDNNKDLINVYLSLQTKGPQFIEDCKTLFVEENNTREKYAELKEEFNTTEDVYRKSIIFIYLNRHCFNGLCRYNMKGNFNTPIGNYDKPYFPEKQLNAVLDKIKKFNIMNKDFKKIIEMAGKNDVVYCDPPYMPLSESASFSAYSQGGFNLKDQIDLAECASAAAKRGATVIISNHYNWYSHQIYTKMFDAKIKVFNVSRTISSNIEKRNPVKELLAIFSPKGNENE